jgi:glucosyl-3-phosphoglycerate phosphatase
MAKIHLYLARHGRTAWNLGRRFQGATDVPLDDVGRAQALELANALRGRFETVVASDLARATETAQIVADAQNLELLALDPDLRERGYGKFEGLTADECAAQYPEVWNAPGRDRNFLPPGGEPVADVGVRVKRGLLRCIERLRGRHQSALVVSHGTALRIFLEELTGERVSSLANLEYREVEHDGVRFTLHSTPAIP